MRWGAISGPNRQADPARALESPPGEFVSEEHRADCARFLDELKTQIQRRDGQRDDSGWVPAQPHGSRDSVHDPYPDR
jgi:hypothetical protein